MRFLGNFGEMSNLFLDIVQYIKSKLTLSLLFFFEHMTVNVMYFSYDFDILILPVLKSKSDGFNASNSPNRAPVSIANKINR